MRGQTTLWVLAATFVAGWTLADASDRRGGTGMDAMLEAIEVDARRTADVTDVPKIDAGHAGDAPRAS